MKIDSEIKSSFQMVATQIRDVKFHNDFLELSKQQLAPETSCTYETHIIETTEQRISGLVDLTIKATIKGAEKRKISVTINVIGCFCDTVNLDRDSFEERLAVNGCAALYSFARAQIMNLFAQSVMDIQSILPMTNVYKLKEKKDAAEKRES